MTTPTEKDPAINMLLSGMMGRDREKTITNGQCMTCDDTADTFRDTLSEKEYAISGMCQKCQDEVFNIHADLD